MFFWNFWRCCEVFWYYLNKELVIVERQGSQVYTIFSLSIPSMDFRCFHLLALVNSAAVNMRVEVSLQDHDFRYFWGSYSSSVFNFWGTTICFSQQLHHSALKKKETMPCATTWMNLENITLSEISQIQQDKYCTIIRL